MQKSIQGEQGRLPGKGNRSEQIKTSGNPPSILLHCSLVSSSTCVSLSTDLIFISASISCQVLPQLSTQPDKMKNLSALVLALGTLNVALAAPVPAADAPSMLEDREPVPEEVEARADYGDYGAYGKYSNYGTYPPPPPTYSAYGKYGKYGTYGTYKREPEAEPEAMPAPQPEAMPEAQPEPEPTPEEVEVAARASYGDYGTYGKYGSYGTYPPPPPTYSTYGKYGSYGTY